ncbi:MAG: hypothetical protein IPG92_13560 [Flavobacteriales bacterium]|nr:hypothetical protein [Flavobacteriales bacterium]
MFNLTATTLNLQRLGGDILIHGDAALSDARKMIITDDGNIGLGILTPVEKLHINGAVVVGDTENAAPMNGTIRYNAGSDELQGVVGNAWTSLGSNWEKVDNTNEITDAIYYNVGSAPRVGIGTTTPDATLQVRGEETCDEGSAAASMGNSSVTLSTSASAARVGLDISCTGVWSSNPEAKNIGLYVSTVSGQSEASSNIAAVMNGNVVVGGITGQQIGTGGTNVLAIQNGAAPAASSGTPTAGIQIYSSELGAGGPSVFHLMTGDGAIVKLYRAPALTPADASAVSSTYDPTTAA